MEPAEPFALRHVQAAASASRTFHSLHTVTDEQPEIHLRLNDMPVMLSRRRLRQEPHIVHTGTW